ncbi:MAG TPA: hypothetical protein VJZ00_12350, partial [Thermoanaerobaculia bacterium]|nr:hypothetical protein [Thermoanaerobaculia bacterium]
GRVQYVEWPRDREMIEIGDAIISNEKIRRVLGWSARVELSDGLQRTRDYFAPVLKSYLQS